MRLVALPKALARQASVYASTSLRQAFDGAGIVIITRWDRTGFDQVSGMMKPPIQYD
jgi:hypothetical protein